MRLVFTAIFVFIGLGLKSQCYKTEWVPATFKEVNNTYIQEEIGYMKPCLEKVPIEILVRPEHIERDYIRSTVDEACFKNVPEERVVRYRIVRSTKPCKREIEILVEADTIITTTYQLIRKGHYKEVPIKCEK